MEDRTCATSDGSMRQPPQAGPAAAAVDSQCPICLGNTNNAAYLPTCTHCFCFVCIERWSRRTNTCPLCRQPFDWLLRSVRGSDQYEQYLVGLSRRQRRWLDTERARSQPPQHSYHLRSRSNNERPSAGSSGPAGNN